MSKGSTCELKGTAPLQRAARMKWNHVTMFGLCGWHVINIRVSFSVTSLLAIQGSTPHVFLCERPCKIQDSWIWHIHSRQPRGPKSRCKFGTKLVQKELRGNMQKEGKARTWITRMWNFQAAINKGFRFPKRLWCQTGTLREDKTGGHCAAEWGSWDWQQTPLTQDLGNCDVWKNPLPWLKGSSSHT